MALSYLQSIPTSTHLDMAIVSCNIYSKWNAAKKYDLATQSRPTTSMTPNTNVSPATTTMMPATKEENLTRLQIKKAKRMPPRAAVVTRSMTRSRQVNDEAYGCIQRNIITADDVGVQSPSKGDSMPLRSKADHGQMQACSGAGGNDGERSGKVKKLLPEPPCDSHKWGDMFRNTSKVIEKCKRCKLDLLVFHRCKKCNWVKHFCGLVQPAPKSMWRIVSVGATRR